MPVALILIDALSASYLTPDILPAVCEVGRGGFAGPIGNIYAYRGIEATLFTGLFPDEHGVWGEFRPSRRWLSESGADAGGGQNEVKPAMDLLARNAISLGDLLPSDRLRLDVRYVASKLRDPDGHLPTGNLIPADLIPYFTASVEKPIWERGSVGSIPTIFDAIRASGQSFEIVGYPTVQHDGQIVERVTARLKERTLPDFWYIKFSALDALGHKYGPKVARLEIALEKLNEQIQTLVSRLQQAYRSADIDITILGDHGMSVVHHTLDVLPILKQSALVAGRDYLYFLDSTTIRFWSDSPRVRRVVSEMFGNVQGARVLDGDDRRASRIPNDVGTGDLLVALEEGCVVFPDFFRKSYPPLGMHGYADVRTEAGLPALATGHETAGLLPDGRVPTHADVWTAIYSRLGLTRSNVYNKELGEVLCTCSF